MKQALLRALQALRECLVRHLLWPALPDRQESVAKPQALPDRLVPQGSAGDLARPDQLEYLAYRVSPGYLEQRVSRVFPVKHPRPQDRLDPLV